MSCSNIIKLHNLNPKKVLVGPEASREGSSFTPLRSQKATPGGANPRQDEELGLEDFSRPIGGAAETHEVVRDALAQAEAMLQAATGKAEEIRLLAYEEGYQQGYAEGIAAAKAELMEHSAQLAELAMNAVVDAPGILSTLEAGVVELALCIAEKVVYKNLAEDRSLVLSLVKGALEYVDILDVLRVRVNPEDLAILRPYWEEGQANTSGRNIELAADQNVQMGGCIIDTKGSIVDAQIETKLAEIENAFRLDLNAGAR